MCEKLSKFWNDLDVTVKVNKREMVLELAVCALTGLVAGMLFSPKKQVTIGSNNGDCVSNALPETSGQDE